MYTKLRQKIIHSGITCPVLAVNGSKDLQVPAKENLAAISAALKKGCIERFGGMD